MACFDKVLIAARGQAGMPTHCWLMLGVQAKGQAECYEYIFEAALRMRDLGINVSRPPPPPLLPAPVPMANGHTSASHPSFT